METAAMVNSMYPFFKKEKINIHISQQKVIMQNIPLKFASLVSYKDAFINLNTVKANCFKIQNRFFARLRNCGYTKVPQKRLFRCVKFGSTQYPSSMWTNFRCRTHFQVTFLKENCFSEGNNPRCTLQKTSVSVPNTCVQV